MISTATKSVQQLLAPDFSKCESPSLRLEKFIVLEDKDRKKDEIQRICDCARKHGNAPEFHLSGIPGAIMAVMQLQSRLIINQAGGILENAGLCLHPHFGCPMIPGSAVKGIAHATAIQAILDVGTSRQKTDLLVKSALVFGWSDQDWSTQKNKSGNFVSDFRYACGGPDWENVWGEAAKQLLGILNVPERQIDHSKPLWKSLPNFAGLISFLPAFPVGKALLAVDIVNCHHPEYYQGKRDKSDDTETPIPNFFPAVEAGAKFEFIIVPARRKFQGIPDNLMNTAMAWLKDGLSFRGAGAKTNAGYGWFEYDETAQSQAEKLARENAAKAEKAARESAAIASMSPDERAAYTYLKSLGNDPLASLKGKMSQIASLPESEQRSICVLFAGKYLDSWKSDVAEALKAKGPDDRRGGKAYKRVNAVRPIAENLGVKLP